MSKIKKLVCISPKVLEFYKAHPTLNFDNINEAVVDLMNMLFENANLSLNATIASQLINKVDGLHGEIVSTIAEHNDALCTQRTTDVDASNVKITQMMDDYSSQITLVNKSTLDRFIGDINEKMDQVTQVFHQSISNSLSSSDERFNYIKDIMLSNQLATNLLQSSVSDLLKKMENSSTKGKCSENILFNILLGLYPSGQVDYVGDKRESGDIMLVRNNKPTILIENKTWGKNVPQEEVKKFIRDIDTQNVCGLFLSQRGGIANKTNFELDVHDKNVLLYVHNVNDDAEKVRVAIEIIDNFKGKLDELDSVDDGNYSIGKEVLDDINREYQYFASQQMIQIKMVKEFSTKMVKQINDVQLTSLNGFLSTRYAFSNNNCVCDICGYTAKNQISLSAHKKGKECKPTATEN